MLWIWNINTNKTEIAIHLVSNPERKCWSGKLLRIRTPLKCHNLQGTESVSDRLCQHHTDSGTFILQFCYIFFSIYNFLLIYLKANRWNMMTPSNGNIFRVTGPMWGETSGHCEFSSRRPVTRGFDVFFDECLNKRLITVQMPVIWDVMALRSLWRHCNEYIMIRTCICHRHIQFTIHLRSTIQLYT